MMECRLQEETARVEKCLLEGSFTETIVACFNTPKANTFDVNLLEPLQKLLRLSPPIAASLARADMFTGILQKLNHKKAVVRLNLLRIVRSISGPHEEKTLSIRRHELFEAIESLAESDSAVLVRNMASELVKLTLEQKGENGRAASRSRQSLIRTSSYTPPSLQSSVSVPLTPTHGGRISSAFIDGSVTPRRNGDHDILYRPRSRDGPGTGAVGGRRSSVIDISNSSAGSRSRLPRTSLRPSKSSMAAPTLRDETLSSTKKENSVRSSRLESTSTASPAPSSSSHLNSKRRPRQPSGDLTGRWS